MRKQNIYRERGLTTSTFMKRCLLSDLVEELSAAAAGSGDEEEESSVRSASSLSCDLAQPIIV